MVKSSRDEMCILFIAMCTSIADVAAMLNVRDISCRVIVRKPRVPSTWSVSMESLRTNNDLEGWHGCLNRRAKDKFQLPLYLLIQLLHKESSLVSPQIRLVSERRLRRHQRTTYNNLQKRLFSLWHEYEGRQKKHKIVLEACSHLGNPFKSYNI